MADRELDSVIVALAPLGGRALRHVDPRRREVDFEDIRAEKWSTGERILVDVAEACWAGVGTVDLGAALNHLDGRFWEAFCDAVATRSGRPTAGRVIDDAEAQDLWTFVSDPDA